MGMVVVASEDAFMDSVSALFCLFSTLTDRKKLQGIIYVSKEKMLP
jgi:hypothetical protein